MSLSITAALTGLAPASEPSSPRRLARRPAVENQANGDGGRPPTPSTRRGQRAPSRRAFAIPAVANSSDALALASSPRLPLRPGPHERRNRVGVGFSPRQAFLGEATWSSSSRAVLETAVNKKNKARGAPAHRICGVHHTHDTPPSTAARSTRRAPSARPDVSADRHPEPRPELLPRHPKPRSSSSSRPRAAYPGRSR